VPGLERSVSASSGVTVPRARFSHSLRGLSPRARMSSEKDVSNEKFFSTRPRTKVPEPWRRVSSPSLTRPSIALRTVIRETPNSAARSRSAGNASFASRMRRSIASRRAR
jgi:hypothetical protein